jgi:hypothetical protein
LYPPAASFVAASINGFLWERTVAGAFPQGRMRQHVAIGWQWEQR